MIKNTQLQILSYKEVTAGKFILYLPVKGRDRKSARKLKVPGMVDILKRFCMDV